jgi:hypothetical protein
MCWPFFWWCKICKVVSIVPKEWACSLRCFAKFDERLFLWKACLCSLKPYREVSPVWPMYALLQSGHVSL